MHWALVDAEPAKPPPPDPGFHKHDGFFMRTVIGPVAGEMRGDLANGQLRITGQGFSESFAFGGAIRENLILYGDYSLEFLLESRGSGAGKTIGAIPGPSGLLLFAPGLAYYFMPGNFCLSGALGLARTMLEEELDEFSAASIEHNSKLGIGGNLGFAKEWWVSANWALGAAIRVSFARTREQETDRPWTYLALAALFSATYN